MEESPVQNVSEDTEIRSSEIISSKQNTNYTSSKKKWFIWYLMGGLIGAATGITLTIFILIDSFIDPHHEDYGALGIFLFVGPLIIVTLIFVGTIITHLIIKKKLVKPSINAFLLAFSAFITTIIIVLILYIPILNISEDFIYDANKKVEQISEKREVERNTPDAKGWELYDRSFPEHTINIRYPSEWDYENKDDEIIFGPILTKNHIGEDVDPYVSRLFIIKRIKNEGVVDLEEYRDISEDLNPQWYNISEDPNPLWNDTIWTNMDGKYVYHSGCVSGVCREVLFQKDNFIYIISDQNQIEDFDQILSTFKFTDSDNN